MFLDQTPPTLPGAPASPGLDAIFQMFKASPGIGIMAVVAFIIIFLVIFKSGDVITYIKERSSKKDDLEQKKIDLDAKKHEDHLAALNKLGTVVDNNTSAINNLEKTVLVSEARTNEKFSDLKSVLHDMKSDIMEKISSSAVDTAHASKLDKIAASLDRKGGEEDSCDGDNK